MKQVCNFSCHPLIIRFLRQRSYMRKFERVSKKPPDFTDRLTNLVIWVSGTSTHDFNRSVGIGSSAHVLVRDVRINFLTSCEVAGSKRVKWFHMREANTFKNNTTNRFPTPKIYKKEVLHEILGQQDQKLAVYNGFNLGADAFSYFWIINLTFLHLYGKYYYSTSINPFPT